MTSPVPFSGISRRLMLSTLAALPTLIGPLQPTSASAQAQSDPLPSWNDGPTKTAITDFVARVTTQGGPDFVPVDERIATFDNDGTLWIEQPMYVQLAFILDRVKALAPQNPDWKNQAAVQAVLDGDMKALAASGEKGLVELMAATHAGMTTDEFAQDRLRVARDRARPALQAALHRAGLSADAGAARLLARQRLQDLHRLGRRHRVHASVGGAGLWHSARAGRGLLDQDAVRDARRQARRCSGCRRSTSSTTRPASRSASTSTSAAGRSRPSATPTATWKCCNGPRWRRRALRADRPSHRRASGNTPTTANRTVGRLDKALDAAALNKWTVVDMKNDWKRVFAFQ